ncbi:hypothetical protein [Lederbergia citrea]|uniref:hypothetical protein n=1 Tax=Lederbergia citrea TaxID=2833581 RepID=UPI001BC925D4|nr:hypothetical protein [Lederbergia citrea]MBS4206181.1 hypothetical protein [Lederbergia citrea]
MGAGEVMMSILPFLMFLVYVVPIIFVIWFAVSVVKLAKERNRTLQDILRKLDNK